MKSQCYQAASRYIKQKKPRIATGAKGVAAAAGGGREKGEGKESSAGNATLSAVRVRLAEQLKVTS